MKKIFLLAVVVIIGMLLRVSLYLDSPMYTTDGTTGYTYPDANEYLNCMAYILEHDLWDYFCNEISVELACGMPLYLTLMHTIFDGNFQHIRILGIFLSCVQIVLVYQIALKVFRDFRIAILAAIFLALNIDIANFSYTLLTETISLFCWSMFVYFYLLSKENNQFYKICIILSAIFLCMATLIRAISLLLPAAMIFLYGIYYLWRKDQKVKSELRTWLAIGAVFYILISPFIIKNHVLFNFNNLCTGGGTALFLGSKLEYQGDEPAFYGSDYGCIYEVIGPNSHRKIKPDRELYAAGVENIKSHFHEYCIMNIKKIARLTIGTNFSMILQTVGKHNIKEVYETYDYETTLKVVARIFFNTFVYAFAILGIYRHYKNFSLSSIILMPMYFLVFSLPFLAIFRYGFILFIFAALLASSEIICQYQSKQYNLTFIGLLSAVLMEMYILSGF